MSFINLKLVKEVPFCDGSEIIGNVNINTDTIAYIEEWEQHYLIKTKLRWEAFRITKEH